MMSTIEVKYRVYKKIRGKGKILNLDQSLAYIFIAISFFLLFTLVAGVTISGVLTKIASMMVLYFVLLFLSNNEKQWEIFRGERIPNEIDLK